MIYTHMDETNKEVSTQVLVAKFQYILTNYNENEIYEMKNKNAMMHLADFMRENYYWEYINERAETWSMRLI